MQHLLWTMSHLNIRMVYISISLLNSSLYVFFLPSHPLLFRFPYISPICSIFSPHFWGHPLLSWTSFSVALHQSRSVFHCSTLGGDTPPRSWKCFSLPPLLPQLLKLLPCLLSRHTQNMPSSFQGNFLSQHFGHNLYHPFPVFLYSWASPNDMKRFTLFSTTPCTQVWGATSQLVHQYPSSVGPVQDP